MFYFGIFSLSSSFRDIKRIINAFCITSSKVQLKEVHICILLAHEQDVQRRCMKDEYPAISRYNTLQFELYGIVG